MNKKSSCPYCGNNPIPHYMNWYFDSLNILFEKLQVGLLCNPIMHFLGRWEDDVTLFLIGGLRLIGIVRFGRKPGKGTLSRAEVLWEEAEKRGLEMREVRVFDRNSDTYVVRKKIPGTKRKKVITFSGIPRPANVNQSQWAIMDDKGAFKKICQKNGLPVGRGGYASSFAEAVKIFDRIDKPVIVKPRLGSRGRHVVTYVRDYDDLRAAYKIAKQLCLWVVVEEQFIAPVYRATVIDFTLAGVLSGTQPLVIGNGTEPLIELIKDKNKHRDAEVAEVMMDQKMAWFLKRQLSCDGRIHLTHGELIKPWKEVSHTHWDKSIFEYVPQKGETVYLSEKIGLSYGGDSAEEYDICHPDNKVLFAKAAQVFGDPIVGFDFMVSDITKSWKDQRCGFLEANTVPFINLHHHPHRGTPRNVAAKVWDLMKM